MNIRLMMKTTFSAALASVLLSSGLLAEDPLRSQLEQVSSLKDFKPAVNDFRIYYIGDSITRHGTNSEILAKLKWDHAAGMAASSEDKDFAHLVAQRIGQMLPEKKVKLFFGPGGNAVSAMNGIEIAKTFQPALVVVQLGEHIPSKSFGDNDDESPEKIASDYGTLLDAVKALPLSPMIICTGSWNPIHGVRKYVGRSAQIDEIQRSVCQQKGVAFVSVEKYALDPSCSGTGNSGGVKWHPNDAGHAGYAREIFTAFEKLAKEGAAKVGDVVFEKPFENENVTWSPQRAAWAKFIPDGHGGSYAEITANSQGEAGAIGNRDVFGNIDRSKASTFLLNTNLSKVFAKLKGYELEIEVEVKGDNLPLSPKPWEGVRIAVGYRTPVGPYNHGYYNVLSGSFDWRNVSYRIRIPSDMEDMGLSLGLIAPSGTVSFRHVKIKVSDIPLTMKTAPEGNAYKGHALPRLRGFVTSIAEPGSEHGRKALDSIASDWKANVAKLWFGLKGDLKDVDPKLDEWMASVDRSLATARQDKIHLILHFSAGWSVKEHGGNQLFYEKPEYAEKFVAAWRSVAQRFKGRKEIYAFELLNESQVRMPIGEGCPDYPELMERAAQAINEIDPDRAIIVQTEEWWGPKAFYKMRPINAKNIIYALHFYSPFATSHQGVEAFQAGKTSWMADAYPGTMDGVKWDKEMLKRELQPVREFQQAYNVQIIVSEFGCVRWALGDSRQKLLSDMIDIFEGYDWDWLYHTYPGWHGWNPEFGNDPWNEKRPETPTTTELLLKGWFAKNQRPTFPDLPPKD